MDAQILLPTAFFLICSAALTVALPAAMETQPRPVAQIAAPGAPARPAPIRRHADGLFYVVARVNGAPVRFLVDTGSSIVILAASDAARAGVRRTDHPSKIRTAAGLSTMARATLARVTISDHILHDVPAAIAPAPVGVSLMGQGMLSRLGSLRIAGDSLTFD